MSRNTSRSRELRDLRWHYAPGPGQHDMYVDEPHVGNERAPSLSPVTDNRVNWRRSIGGKPAEDAEWLAYLGAAKATEILGRTEINGFCAIDKGSVYGTMVAFPQIARSAGWPKTLTALSMRSFVFLLLNYALQFSCAYFIHDSQHGMNAFSGQMHLCDFAAHVSDCPDSSNCLGPGGTRVENPGSLYTFDIWNTRRFARDIFVQMFPDRKEEIMNNVNVGEYGVESYYCRLLCVFIFMVSIGEEFQSIAGLASLLYHLPNDAEPWVQYEEPKTYMIGRWGSMQVLKETTEKEELDFVKFRVAGMPLTWKFVNLVILLIPRVYIMMLISRAGVHFLMETSGMIDGLINATVLSFVLGIDEMLHKSLATRVTKHILDSLEDHPLFDPNEFEDDDQDLVMRRYKETELGWRFSCKDFWLFPRRLSWGVVLACLLLWEYYHNNCQQLEDGSMVSKDLELPHMDHEPFWCVLTSCSHSHAESTIWTMPDVK